jgi:hypothetical protein
MALMRSGSAALLTAAASRFLPTHGTFTDVVQPLREG